MVPELAPQPIDTAVDGAAVDVLDLAVGTAEERVTVWTYGGTFPDQVTQRTGPTATGEAATRTEIRAYEAGTGNLLSLTRSGEEATYPGGAFTLTTTRTFNIAGQVEQVDPPGHGTADVTTWTYDATRGDLVPLTRTDPLIDTTTYSHDPLNRQVSVTDPNGVETVTTFDALDRVTEVRQKGATPAEDLVTTYEYTRSLAIWCAPPCPRAT